MHVTNVSVLTTPISTNTLLIIVLSAFGQFCLNLHLFKIRFGKVRNEKKDMLDTWLKMVNKETTEFMKRT